MTSVSMRGRVEEGPTDTSTHAHSLAAEAKVALGTKFQVRFPQTHCMHQIVNHCIGSINQPIKKQAFSRNMRACNKKFCAYENSV